MDIHGHKDVAASFITSLVQACVSPVCGVFSFCISLYFCLSFISAESHHMEKAIKAIGSCSFFFFSPAVLPQFPWLQTKHSNLLGMRTVNAEDQNLSEKCWEIP